MLKLYLSIICIFTINGLFAYPLLPEPFKQPRIPKPGAVECTSCGYGERPKIDRFCYPVARINLFEEKNLPENELLTVNIGEPGPFAPESRYLIYPPGAPGAIKNYLLAKLGVWKVLFRAKMDKIGSVSFFARNLPGYAIRRKGDYLVLTDYNSLREFSFTSLDAGQTWKLIKLRRLNQPNCVITCEYDNEGYMTKLILPGAKSYKIDYKYGQVQKVISPNGAVTEFHWDESGFLSQLKTVLTEKHPFYDTAKKISSKRYRKTKSLIVRDMYLESTMDGHLASLITTYGERYRAEYMLDRGKHGKVTTGILSSPNGRRDYRINKTYRGRRESEKGLIVEKDGQEAFLPYQKLRYVTKNGSLHVVSSNGIKKKRAPGSLAIIEKTDALDNKTKYKYNKLWLPTQTTNPDGSIAQKEYDDDGKIIKEVDECGRTKIYKRGQEGLLLEYKFGDAATAYEYDSNGYPIKTITPDGLVHRFAWDQFGRMVSHVKPDGVTLKYQYRGTLDSLFKLTTTDSDNGESYSQTYLYDAKGRLGRIYYSDKTYEGFAYNCCNMIAKRSRSGRVTRYTYDSSRKLTRVSVNKKITYQAEYDIYGRLLKKTKANGAFTSRKYSKDWHVSETETSDGTIKKYSRNAAGWVDKAVNNKGTEVLYKYNYKRKITSIRGTEQPWKDYSYDRSGNLVAMAFYGNPQGLKPELSRKVKYKFDSLNRKIKAVYPDGRIYQKVYKKGSEQLNYTRLDNIYTFYTYNEIGKVKSTSVITESELKNALTKLEREELVASRVTEVMTYDKWGRLDAKYDKRKNLLAKYLYSGNSNRAKYIVEPVSDKIGAVFSYRRERKKFVKYIKLTKLKS